MAYEIGIPYVLIGPSGDRIAFNDRTDADFVGFLDPEDGIVGLDSPTVRASGEDNVGADGGRNGLGYNARRPVSFKGQFDASVSITEVNENVDRTIAILDDCARRDAVMLWQEHGRPMTQLLLRRAAEPRVQGRLPKTFTLPFISEYDRIVGAVEKSSLITPVGTSTGGVSSPVTSPATSSSTTVASQLLVNAGRKGAHPRFHIEGPTVNPVILNVATGDAIVINATLAVGEYIDIETRPGKRYCRINGYDRWGAIDFDYTTWFELGRGSTEVRLLSFTSSATTTLTAFWRDTWIS
jgi:hypothetical protein